MDLLELVSDTFYRGFFVDLYVRCNNQVAVEMYEGMGYSVYRRVREYYGSLGIGRGGRDEEDAFGEESKSMYPHHPSLLTETFLQICASRYLGTPVVVQYGQMEGKSWCQLKKSPDRSSRSVKKLPVSSSQSNPNINSTHFSARMARICRIQVFG